MRLGLLLLVLVYVVQLGFLKEKKLQKKNLISQPAEHV